MMENSHTLEGLCDSASQIGAKASFFASTVFGPEGEPMNLPVVDTSATKNGYADWYFNLDKQMIKIKSATFVSLLINTVAVKSIGLPLDWYFIWGDDAELQSLLTADEYKEARASTLNAFYTSPTVIKAMYEALGNMGLSKGNVLETKKAELFAKVRAGQVRILMGSTPKLGAGTNIQDRLIALHHLDCPWKPSDLEQQEGRILRQGNRNQKVKIFRYVTENTFDSYMWQILENKQKFISQIMTSKSPVRACDDVDDTALTYAEIKALATGNPYIKEKMDLDIQVSKLKLMRANHTSQIYSLESDIARRYPAEITAAKERIAGLKADLAVAKPLLEQDKEKFSITVEDRVYTDRKEAGSAILAACAAMKIAKTEGQIADLGGFAISSRFDAFAQTFKLTIKRQSSYTIELGSDPAGNIQRILNALASIEKTLPQVERRLETLQQQLAEAKEEVQRPFPQEAELNEKSARLAELNALLDMDEKGDDAALGMDEEVTESEIPAPKREIERSADSVKRPSILAQLHEKQAERMAEPKPQKKKSHDMEL